MTLAAAYRTGKKFRLGTTGAFIAATSFNGGAFTVAQLSSEDWAVEPDAKLVTKELLAAAWDSAREDFTSVASSGESRLFAALAAKLLG